MALPGDERPASRPLESEAELIARAGSRSVGVVRVEDQETIAAVMGVVATDTKHEVFSTLPGGPYSVDYLRSSWEKDIEVLARGVAIRAIYQADAVRSPEVLRYLTDFAGAGAKVRVAARVRYRTIIVDRNLAVIAVNEDSLGVPFLVVREPAMVRSCQAQFAALWKVSHSVGMQAEDSLGSDLVRETLELLRSGVTDEVAAKRVGVSVRTVRRRVAAVLDLLDAGSRFEAGVKAAEAGWV